MLRLRAGSRRVTVAKKPGFAPRVSVRNSIAVDFVPWNAESYIVMLSVATNWHRLVYRVEHNRA